MTGTVKTRYRIDPTKSDFKNLRELILNYTYATKKNGLFILTEFDSSEKSNQILRYAEYILRTELSTKCISNEDYFYFIQKFRSVFSFDYIKKIKNNTITDAFGNLSIFVELSRQNDETLLLMNEKGRATSTLEDCFAFKVYKITDEFSIRDEFRLIENKKRLAQCFRWNTPEFHTLPQIINEPNDWDGKLLEKIIKKYTPEQAYNWISSHCPVLTELNNK